MKEFLLLILMFEYSLSQTNKECSLLSNEHISYGEIHEDFHNHTIIIHNFNDFEDLNFKCYMKIEVLSLIIKAI